MNLIGFGPSAIGSLPGGYVQNTRHMIGYRDAIMAGGQQPCADAR